MKKLKGNFTTIPNEFIVNNKLDVYEFRVLCYLCKICDNNNACYPSQQTIANNTNISIAKVKKAVKRLVELGIVTAVCVTMICDKKQKKIANRENLC